MKPTSSTQEDQEFEQEQAPVAFGSWRCNCTILARSLEEIPPLCPVHGSGLLGPVSWESNPNMVALGLEVAS